MLEIILDGVNIIGYVWLTTYCVYLISERSDDTHILIGLILLLVSGTIGLVKAVCDFIKDMS